ncbi:hypothetical protein PG990_009511 [Apiospora arundinis]|uniref:Uncharacterized protein n=1 Tax=Apiospora arundinis TaxID=335852 RepID=A0ABR2IT20_9PEZI
MLTADAAATNQCRKSFRPAARSINRFWPITEGWPPKV